MAFVFYFTLSYFYDLMVKHPHKDLKNSFPIMNKVKLPEVLHWLKVWVIFLGFLEVFDGI